MSRVVIHAGPGKTGTSAIQLWLNQHREELRAEGIHYPAHDTDANGVSSGNLYRVLDRFAPGDIHVSSDLVAELLAEFEATGCHTLLLSSEFFFPVIPELDAAFPGAEFIAYLRDPLEMFESNYNQGVKRHGCRVQLHIPQKLPLGHIAALERFKKARPELRVDVRPYLQELFVGGNLVADLLAAVGSALEAGPAQRVNASYSPEGLEFKRQANCFPLASLEPELDALLQRVAPATEPYSLLPEARHEAVRAQISQDVQALADQLGLERVRELPARLLARPKPRFAAQAATLEQLGGVVERMAAAAPGVVDRLRQLVEAHPQVPTTNAAFFEALSLEPRGAVSEAELAVRVSVRDFAESIASHPEWKPADIARELALFAERRGQLHLAVSAVSTALEMRPEDATLQKKRREYAATLKKQQEAAAAKKKQQEAAAAATLKKQQEAAAAQKKQEQQKQQEAAAAPKQQEKTN